MKNHQPDSKEDSGGPRFYDALILPNITFDARQCQVRTAHESLQKKIIW